MTARRCEARGRQPDRPAIAEWDQAFDRALAKTLGAEQHRATIVLQCADDQFSFARRTAIDQSDQRQTLCDIARSGAQSFGAARLAAFNDSNVTLVEKGVGNGDGGIEIAPRVVPQIDNESCRLLAGLLPDLLNRAGERRRSVRVEAGDTQIPDIAHQDPRRDGLQLEGLALDLEIDRGTVAAPQGQVDLASCGTAQLLFRFT